MKDKTYTRDFSNGITAIVDFGMIDDTPLILGIRLRASRSADGTRKLARALVVHDPDLAVFLRESAADFAKACGIDPATIKIPHTLIRP